eukprot:6199666-Pleurochrysis_carterae.AAC.4
MGAQGRCRVPNEHLAQARVARSLDNAYCMDEQGLLRAEGQPLAAKPGGLDGSGTQHFDAQHGRVAQPHREAVP